MNLNNIDVADEDGTNKWEDNSVVTSNATVYFRELEYHLMRHIKQADAVVGAVAWLSNYDILDALATLDTVSIVVQKEDFLRPDSKSDSKFHTTIRSKYASLKSQGNIGRCSLEGTIGPYLSYCGDSVLDTVRCAGNHNSLKQPSHPRMHNKFLVFCKVKNTGKDQFHILEPYAVWTGSFNFSYAASMSLENAIYLTEPNIVMAYFKEFAQIYAISEELDWQSEWCSPEFRIGS